MLPNFLPLMFSFYFRYFSLAFFSAPLSPKKPANQKGVKERERERERERVRMVTTLNDGVRRVGKDRDGEKERERERERERNRSLSLYSKKSLEKK